MFQLLFFSDFLSPYGLISETAYFYTTLIRSSPLVMTPINLREEIERRLKVAESPSILQRIEPVHRTPSYFWGQNIPKKLDPTFCIETGYVEARRLIADGNPQRFAEIVHMGLETLARIFKELDNPHDSSNNAMVTLRLSDELQQWREKQHRLGRTLPSKGHGLTRASGEVIKILRVEKLPLPLLINGALFGSGFANMLIGAHDAETLYSNYCTDMGFFYEHSYHKAFPEYEPLLKQASNDPHSLQTPGGIERRLATDIGLEYVSGKITFEENYKAKVMNKTARLNRHNALALFFCESSILGMAAEAMARGFDKAGVVNDFAFSSPGTDVVDVGSDLHNSELVNAFLNTADIAETAVITEDALRRVYDAYAHSGAKMFTKRWSDPGARMCATLYTWHIQNNRHEFFRRALLGYSKARKTPSTQREADFCEAFDSDLHTTGFSRPLEGACNGADPCDQVGMHLRQDGEHGVLADMWWLLSTGPSSYVKDGVVSSDRESEMAEGLRVAMARAYSLGLVDEMTWLMSHANHHAWQVNYLFEAAMFGSFLDDGGLKSRLDRREE